MQRVSLRRAGPLRRRIGGRDVFRLFLARGAEGRIVQHVEIFTHRAGRGHRIDGRRVPVLCFQRPAFVRIRLDEAGVHREVIAAHQTLGDAALHGLLEHMAQQIAVAEASMPVIRERRVIRHTPRQIEAAEPAIGKLQMNLLAQPPFRTDTEDVAHQKHPDHQFRIDRRAAGLAVERRKPFAHIAKVDEPVNHTQQVIGRNRSSMQKS